jgi:hypothetical protein
MKKASRTLKQAGLQRGVKWIAMLFLAAVVQGVAAEELSHPVAVDFAQEIKQQGAAALQEMTRELKHNRNWSKLGAKELETTLKQHAITDDQVVNYAILPECDECKDCHNCNERS